MCLCPRWGRGKGLYKNSVTLCWAFVPLPLPSHTILTLWLNPSFLVRENLRRTIKQSSQKYFLQHFSKICLLDLILYAWEFFKSSSYPPPTGFSHYRLIPLLGAWDSFCTTPNCIIEVYLSYCIMAVNWNNGAGGCHWAQLGKLCSIKAVFTWCVHLFTDGYQYFFSYLFQHAVHNKAYSNI